MVNNRECFARIKYTKQDLASHLNTVHSIAKFPCEVCGKHFVSQSKLKQHSQVHTPVTKICPFGCSKNIGVRRMAEHLGGDQHFHDMAELEVGGIEKQVMSKLNIPTTPEYLSCKTNNRLMKDLALQSSVRGDC